MLRLKKARKKKEIPQMCLKMILVLVYIGLYITYWLYESPLELQGNSIGVSR